MSATLTEAPRRGPAVVGGDPRLLPAHWAIPPQRAARRRALVLALICLPLAFWYLDWLLRGQRVGDAAMFGLLIAAETFNLVQAIGFWWTCARQRTRGARRPARDDLAVDVMVPTYDEPIDVVEPTIAAACAMRGADTRVWLLDDGHRADLRALADRYGVGYLRRPDRTGAKAGNINHALAHTDAPFVAVFDSDHVPRPNFLLRVLGHFDDDGVGFVQTPQYYANAGRGAIPAAAAAQQSLFFGPIARGKDGLGSMICCGTNVVFRRRALVEAGGFPERSVTEDFLLSVRLHERGWQSVYFPEVVACGLGPEDMASYVSQQQRWARGCLGAIPAVLMARLPIKAKLQYLLSATYFLSGWTLLLYMSLPVVRLWFGLQPLAGVSADQFLLHFGPYYCGALAAVAMAGWGTYTFRAFALQASSFWIHVHATLRALLGRAAGFVVTPKHGERRRQPRAVAPVLVAVAVLVVSSAAGLAHSHGAATLNNVAFAMLHASILIIGASPALLLARSAPLAPEPATQARPRPRRWPRPVLVGALAVAALVPMAIAVLGARGLRAPLDSNQLARQAAQTFMRRYVAPGGRVIRRDQGGDTVSEGQAYGMLLAVALDDHRRFAAIWGWTQAHLRRPDGLLSEGWADGHVTNPQPATDADLDAAEALSLAARRFGTAGYRREAALMGRAILAQETIAGSNGSQTLTAGPWANTDPAVINPSYFSPRAYANLATVARDPRWRRLESSSRSLISRLVAGRHLPPDWAALYRDGALRPIASPSNPAGGGPAASSFDAARVAVRLAASCQAADRRLAAGLWPLYRRRPGRDSYTTAGTPTTSWTTPVSYVAAAAAAQAAGHPGARDRLLGTAQAEAEAHPTYYGAAWVALGRVLLTTQALGGC